MVKNLGSLAPEATASSKQTPGSRWNRFPSTPARVSRAECPFLQVSFAAKCNRAPHAGLYAGPPAYAVRSGLSIPASGGTVEMGEKNPSFPHGTG